MKTPLLIVGAGNVGGFLSYNIEEFGDYDIIGFLDDDKNKIGKTIYDRQVLGPVSTAHQYRNKNIAVAIGIANPFIKRKIAKDLTPLGFQFPSFISQNIWLSKHVKVGKGVILYPSTSINYATDIGNFVIVNMNCAIGHNCSILDYTTLAPGVNLGGFTHIGEAVDIGIGVSTKQGITIGDDTIIGGQSMLIHDVIKNSKIVGVPGRCI